MYLLYSILKEGGENISKASYVDSCIRVSEQMHTSFKLFAHNKRTYMNTLLNNCVDKILEQAEHGAFISGKLSKTTGNTKLLPVSIEESVHFRFMAFAIENRTSIQELLENFIVKILEEDASKNFDIEDFTINYANSLFEKRK